MPRIVGVDIPEAKRVEAALTYIYGIGKNNVLEVLKRANIDPDKRVKDLNRSEVATLQKVIEEYNVEGTLRKTIRDNVDRLKRIGSYRGTRHAAALPTRGQRTRVNARTRRGKKKTVGAMRKEDMAK